MNKINEAMAYATEKHKNQRKKIIGEPYINHIIDVANILKENGADEETIIVGILHDTLEDTDATYSEIKNLFGKKIADMVKIESELKELPYKQRKAEHMKRVRKSSYNTKLVNCADKVSNLKSMIRIYKKGKEDIWKWFSGSKEDIIWYYTLALGALKEVSDKKVYQDFCKLYKKMFNKEIIYANLLTDKEIRDLFDKIVPQDNINWYDRLEISRYENYTNIVAWSVCDYTMSIELYNHKAEVSGIRSNGSINDNYIKEMYKIFGKAFSGGGYYWSAADREDYFN